MIYLIILLILFMCILCLNLITIQEPFDNIKTYNIETDSHELDVGPAYLDKIPCMMYLKAPCKQQIKDKYKLIAERDGVKYFKLNCFKLM